MFNVFFSSKKRVWNYSIRCFSMSLLLGSIREKIDRGKQKNKKELKTKIWKGSRYWKEKIDKMGIQEWKLFFSKCKILFLSILADKIHVCETNLQVSLIWNIHNFTNCYHFLSGINAPHLLLYLFLLHLL